MCLQTVLVLALLSNVALASDLSSGYTAEIEAGNRAVVEGDFKAAISHFEKAVAAKPNAPEPHIRIAYALIQKNSIAFEDFAELRRAKQEEEAALALSADNPDALAGLAQITYELGKPSGPNNLFAPSTGTREAFQLLERALKSDPNNYAALYRSAKIESSEIYRQVWEALLRARSTTPGQRPKLSPEQKQQLRERLSTSIRQAMDHAEKAAAVRPDGAEAMHELSGLHMVRASIASTTSEEQAELAAQRDWESRSQLAYAKARREAASGAELGH